MSITYESERLPPGSHDPWLSTSSSRSGYEPRDWKANPLGYAAPEFNLELIPESQWVDIIEEREKRRTTARDKMRRAGFKPLHQGRTNFCWVFATVQCMHYLLAASGLPMRQFSPASCGSPITNFTNSGNWGTNALQRLLSDGVNEVEDWPSTAIDRRYYTEENRERARLNKVVEAVELPRRDLAAMTTLVLSGIPVSCGYDWWRHQVVISDVVVKSGKLLWLADNSGLGRDNEGFTYLSRDRAVPDDACAPLVLTPRAET